MPRLPRQKPTDTCRDTCLNWYILRSGCHAHRPSAKNDHPSLSCLGILAVCKADCDPTRGNVLAPWPDLPPPGSQDTPTDTDKSVYFLVTATWTEELAPRPWIREAALSLSPTAIPASLTFLIAIASRLYSPSPLSRQCCDYDCRRWLSKRDECAANPIPSLIALTLAFLAAFPDAVSSSERTPSDRTGRILTWPHSRPSVVSIPQLISGSSSLYIVPPYM